MKDITVLFPGFFDPFHKGHLSLLEAACQKVGATRAVIIVLDADRSAERKLLVRAALKEAKKECPKIHFDVTSSHSLSVVYEDLVTSSVLSYSYSHPFGKLYLLLGLNRFVAFTQFKEAEKISKRCTLLVAPYPGLQYREEDLEKFNAEKSEDVHIPFTSAQIRKGSVFPFSFEEASLIADNRMYFLKNIKEHMKEKRYLHSVSVAKTASKIASKNGLDPQKAFLAGLLHDSGKDYPVEEQRSIVAAHFASFEPVKDFALHQFVSCYLANTLYGVTDQEILDAIEFHCTGNGNMSEMQKCLYAADKVEPLRVFPTKKARLACYRSLEEGFKVMLEEQKKYFISQGIPYKEEVLSKKMYHTYLGED